MDRPRDRGRHLAWARLAEVKYVSFPSSQTTPLAAAENVFTPVGDGAHQPAIMVGPGASGPIIRIAFVEHRPPAPRPPNPLFYNLLIRERGAGGWSQVYFDSGTYYSSGALVSVSADVNPSTGDAYVVVSRTIDGASFTALVRENTLTPGNSFSYHLLFPSAAPLVSVAARTESCESRFRIVSSTPSSPGSGHGSASYRTGTWTGGAAPTWIEAAPVGLLGVDRAGTALLQSLAVPNTAISHFFHGTYEERVGLTFRLLDSYDSAPTPAPCN
jgi:hypothetical protein